MNPCQTGPFDTLKSPLPISRRMSNVAVSWTGGRDSSLALYESELMGCRINCLLTFAPSRERFLAHPLALMKLQARALALPHLVIAVEEPFERSYENAIASVKEERGIDALVTGDIGEVAGHDPNWMADRSTHCGVDLLRPLWHQDRLELLNRLLSLGFKTVFRALRGLGSQRNGLDWSSLTVHWCASVNWLNRLGLMLAENRGNTTRGSWTDQDSRRALEWVHIRST